MTSDISRPPKKTEMIEVRVSHETKRDFLAACRGAGRSASDVVREGIEEFIEDQKRPFQVPEIREEKRPLVMTIPQPIRKRRYLAVGAAGVVGLTLLAAMPSAAAPDSQAVFKRLDVNGDGVLSPSEFSGPVAKDMKQFELKMINQGAAPGAPATKDSQIFILPPDTDGQAAALQREVSHQTLSASGQAAPGMAEMRKADFLNYDANKDGKVTLAEYQTHLREMLTNGFERLDADKSGALDAEEYANIGVSLLILPANADTTLPTLSKFGPVAVPSTLEANFARLDANKDGKLSLQEYLPAN